MSTLVVETSSEEQEKRKNNREILMKNLLSTTSWIHINIKRHLLICHNLLHISRVIWKDFSNYWKKKNQLESTILKAELKSFSNGWKMKKISKKFCSILLENVGISRTVLFSHTMNKEEQPLFLCTLWMALNKSKCENWLFVLYFLNNHKYIQFCYFYSINIVVKDYNQLYLIL